MGFIYVLHSYILNTNVDVSNLRFELNLKRQQMTPDVPYFEDPIK